MVFVRFLLGWGWANNKFGSGAAAPGPRGDVPQFVFGELFCWEAEDDQEQHADVGVEGQSASDVFFWWQLDCTTTEYHLSVKHQVLHTPRQHAVYNV